MIKEFIWFKLLTRCPRCHRKLKKVGYPDGFMNARQRYKCVCGWGEENKLIKEYNEAKKNPNFKKEL